MPTMLRMRVWEEHTRLEKSKGRASTFSPGPHIGALNQTINYILVGVKSI
jgi:hypothetical protein